VLRQTVPVSLPLEKPLDKTPRYGLELVAVLGVSYGISGVQSLLSFIEAQVKINRGFGFKNVATGPLNPAEHTEYQWLDLLKLLADILQGLLPIVLVVVLLARSPGGPGLGVGLDRIRAREWAQGAGFAALIGIPGLGLVYVARQLGINAQIVVTDLPDVWYRIPVLVLNAIQDGAAEEIVVCAYVLTRLGQLGWSAPRALALAAVLRGSYHLYQGYGGFAGNAVMGVLFGLWFLHTRRVWPLVIAHSLIDAVSFVGYVYLHGHVDWI
jgi:membrane protease YdiL (CAAX protease family)